MKERILFLLLVVSSFLAGCSNSDHHAPSQPGERVSDVPILLQSDTRFPAYVSTRAMVNDITEPDSLGIFCLAREKTGIGGSDDANDVDWNVVLDNTSTGYGFTTNGIYWSNLACTAVDTGEENAMLEVLPGQDYIWYYPITSWYGYDFFGYYPRQQSYVHNSDSVYVDIETDGNIDILWGRSEKIDNKYAYSARYVKSQETSVAHMHFKHSLTQFQFYFVAQKSWNKQEMNADFSQVKNLKIKDVCILDTYSNLRMVVAHRLDDSRSGAIVPANRYDMIDIALKDSSGVEVSENPIPFSFSTNELGEEVSDTVRVGDGIMVCPNEKEYYMSVCLCDADDPEKEYWSEKRITIKLSGDNARFKSGYIYKIYVTVVGVSTISIDATLEDWQEADPDESLKFELN